MIQSISKELCAVEIPRHEGQFKMMPFELSDLLTVPEKFRDLVGKMIESLPIKKGISFLTVDCREIQAGNSHRRGGAHIDGNYIPENSVKGNWGGGNGWKVGEGGRVLSSEHHKLSYESETGGMLIVSDYAACKGWNGDFEGKPYVGGDCTRVKLDEGFILKPNVVYYGNSQFIHESLPISENVFRHLVRITLPIDYPQLFN